MQADEDKKETASKHKNGSLNTVVKEIDVQLLWPVNITIIDLSSKDIQNIDLNVNFPPNLVNLNLSRNRLTSVPHAVLEIKHLKILDLSFNKLLYFDDKPLSCHSLEEINLSNNCLKGPPQWIWHESPKSLQKLVLSNNQDIISYLSNDHFEDLLQYNIKLNEIVISKCSLINDSLKLLSTFSRVKVLELGVADLKRLHVNTLRKLPCEGLDKCCDLERLVLCNTQINIICSNIDLYEKLVFLDLSQNNINNLPNEFCNLQNLQVCLLSQNNLLYLPDNFHKLKNLKRLDIDSNSLCILPDELPKLSTLDLYDNNLNEVCSEVLDVPELDLAQNYLDEPDDKDYKMKKEKIRLNKINRWDGRKTEILETNSEHSKSECEDGSLEILNSNHQEIASQSSSSVEDWDADEYWIPHYNPVTTQIQSSWLHFVHRKMAEGNFCPMDVHPVSVVEQVNYEKLLNPTVAYESEGQFDDYSEDDS